MKTKLLLILFGISILQASAQKHSKEFTIYGGGGASFFLSPPSSSASSIGYHADIGFGFTYFFSHTVGFHVGAGFGINNITAKVGKLQTITPDSVNRIGNYIPFEEYKDDGTVIPRYGRVHTTLYDYTEKYQTKFLSIPIMFQLQTKPKQQPLRQGKKANFYAMTGIKILFFFDQKYEVSLKALENEIDFGYGPLLGFPEPHFSGLGIFNNDQKGYITTGKLGVGMLALFTFEAGVKWRIREKLLFYTGTYFDCGMNDPIKKNRQSLNIYHDPVFLEELTLLSFANRINLMGVGIKLRLAFWQLSKREGCHYWR